MAVLVVYDTVFGNTGQIAKAIADALTGASDVRLVSVADTASLNFKGVDLLIVGSPTRGFRPTPKTMEFVHGIPDEVVRGLPAATFDTRIDPADIRPAPLRWIVKAGGYAADVLAGALARRGAVVISPSAGFAVTRTQGPLKPGEPERAERWARDIAAERPAAA